MRRRQAGAASSLRALSVQASRLQSEIHGAGLGLRRAFLEELPLAPRSDGFIEVAPENWIHVKGNSQPVGPSRRSSADGMSRAVLNLGGQAALDIDLVKTFGGFCNSISGLLQRALELLRRHRPPV